MAADKERPRCRAYHPHSNVKVYAFGKPDGDFKPDRKRIESFSSIAKMVKPLGVTILYCPNPSQLNGQISQLVHFSEEIEIDGVKIMLGAESDGIMLPPGTAVAFASADCPTLAVVDEESRSIYGVHCAFKSLIDFQKITSGKPSRQNGSVIDLLNLGPKTTAFSCVGISSGYNFPINDPDQIKAKNNELIRHWLTMQYGHLGRKLFNTPPRERDAFKPKDEDLSLHDLIACQLMSHGVKSSQIHHDSVDTFTDKKEKEDYRWWSNKRGDKERNLVVVHHTMS